MSNNNSLISPQKQISSSNEELLNETNSDLLDPFRPHPNPYDFPDFECSEQLRDLLYNRFSELTSFLETIEAPNSLLFNTGDLSPSQIAEKIKQIEHQVLLLGFDEGGSKPSYQPPIQPQVQPQVQPQMQPHNFFSTMTNNTAQIASAQMANNTQTQLTQQQITQMQGLFSQLQQTINQQQIQIQQLQDVINRLQTDFTRFITDNGEMRSKVDNINSDVNIIRERINKDIFDVTTNLDTRLRSLDSEFDAQVRKAYMPNHHPLGGGLRTVVDETQAPIRNRRRMDLNLNQAANNFYSNIMDIPQQVPSSMIQPSLRQMQPQLYQPMNTNTDQNINIQNSPSSFIPNPNPNFIPDVIASPIVNPNPHNEIITSSPLAEFQTPSQPISQPEIKTFLPEIKSAPEVEPEKVQSDLQPELKLEPQLKTNTPIVNELDEMPVGKGTKLDVEENAEIKLVTCRVGCGRRFNEKALKNHEKICHKVFQQRRDQFDITDMRMTKEAKEVERPKESPKPKKNNTVPKWKRDRDLLKNAIEAGKALTTALQEGRDISTIPKPAALPDYRTPCPHCGRKFNEEVAARHIPKCPKRK